jgi:hypothetical protein
MDIVIKAFSAGTEVYKHGDVVDLSACKHYEKLIKLRFIKHVNEELKPDKKSSKKGVK